MDVSMGRSVVRLVLVVGFLLTGAPIESNAVVVCQKKNKVKLRVDTCKNKETMVLDLGPGSVDSEQLGDGAVSDRHVAPDAQIQGSKIAGMPGLSDEDPQSSFVGIPANDSTVQVIDSGELDAPTDGHVVVLAVGHVIFFGDGRTISLGISQAADAFSDSVTDVGRHDGTADLRFHEAFALMEVFPVSAGPQSFSVLAQGHPVFQGAAANIVIQKVVPIFVPSLY